MSKLLAIAIFLGLLALTCRERSLAARTYHVALLILLGGAALS